MAKNHDMHQIGKVGQKCGVSIHTIRYYEKLGLLGKPSRSEGGFRLYSQNAIDKLKFIKQAQSLGFTLSEIQQIIEASTHGLDNCCNYISEILKEACVELGFTTEDEFDQFVVPKNMIHPNIIK